jgi:hypothetical protein
MKQSALRLLKVKYHIPCLLDKTYITQTALHKAFVNTALLALLSRSVSVVIIHRWNNRILVCVHMSLPHNTANLVIDDVTLTTKIHGCQLYTIMNSPVEIFTNGFLLVACCGILPFKLWSRTKFCIS